MTLNLDTLQNQEYLADGVYVGKTEFGEIVLYTQRYENQIDVIYMEYNAIVDFFDYLKRINYFQDE